MTKHKEKEEDIIEQKDMKKEVEKELEEVADESGEPTAESAAGEGEKTEKRAQEPVDPKALADKYLDNWKRAVADFENYKKRQAQSSLEFAKYANLDLIMQILPVIDNFQAATAHIPADQKDGSWVVGIMHIQKQLEKVLEDNGVSEIEVKEGDDFDPSLHEAMGDQETRDKKQETNNKIKKIVWKGYKIDDRVIRPARVVVG
jgi:molecular chaperone GrpE